IPYPESRVPNPESLLPASEFSDVNILVADLHSAARVELQSDDAFGEVLIHVHEVDTLHAVEARNDVAALPGDFQIVPIVRLVGPLGRREAHRQPGPAG